MAGPARDARAAERIKAHITFLADDLLQGRETGTPGFDIAAAYVASQLAQPIDYAAGAKFAAINYEITRELADADKAPSWNKGDFFGTLFGKKP